MSRAKEDIEQLETEYREGMAVTLQRYIAMGKRIRMMDEEILKEAEKHLDEGLH